MSNSRELYIQQYSNFACEQMRRYGIPASVTLAQAIIESANGQSMLSHEVNNHFGIKGDYNGAYVLANDDKPNERFKKYDSVGQSYEDHSKVLMTDRYIKYTSGLASDDYRGWAEAIKKGGYATSSSYVNTLCNVIENNNLQLLDQQVMAQMKAEGKSIEITSNPQNNTSESQSLKSTGMDLPNGLYSMPVKRDEFMLITSPYGNRKDPMDKSKAQIHHGIDIKTNHDALLATENNGKVVAINCNSNSAGGKSVTLEYERSDGSKTRIQYMHLAEINVKMGDVLGTGQKIGTSGNTGTRTTGEHLHFGVINVSADGKQQWVNPTAYLAEINAKGNLNIEAQHNGKNLLAQYAVNGSTQKPQVPEQETTPENWLEKLMSSNDSALGLGLLGGDGENQGLLGTIMQLFVTLLMLATQMENKSKEEKMEAITDAVINRKIDLSSFVSNMQSAELSIKNDGKAVLNLNDGKNQYAHELTEAERTRLSQVLNSDNDDATKRQRIGNMITAIGYSEQASKTYEQLESQQQSQQQSMQRK